MEVIGTVMSVTQTLFAALQNSELKDILSVFGYKSELQNLQRTVSTIRAVFQDAEKKQTLSAVELQLLEELKDAVYEADDLLDEFVTRAQMKQLLDASGSLSAKVRDFFTPSKNHLSVAYKMSKGVKKIRKKLDAIAYNKQFCFVHDPEPIRMRRPETCSYVNEVDIIGRGEDLEKIVGMLNADVQTDLSFLSIVGIGGLGKTALAQLVFNDLRVKTAFPLRLWACVSDQDHKKLDVKEVIGKILASGNLDVGSTLDQKQTKLQQLLASERYLLVLDDVWTEKREEWYGLVQYLGGGRRRNWIVVTTRSQETARIIGGKTGHLHELQGLSEADSWRLFAKTAFGPEESSPPPDDDLVKLGREIVDGCVGVPLAIRVVGSLLYCQDNSKWQSVKEIGLANIRKSEDGIMSILQLSYHHLEAPLKSCFRYCALFPKDYEIEKEMLIQMWIAQGYVFPFYEGQSVENAGEDYFSILLKRCLFQDIRRNELGEIVSCKMHDLIHDIAQNVSGKEIVFYTADTSNGSMNDKVHHFSIMYEEYNKHSLDATNVRTYIHVHEKLSIGVVAENCFVERIISSCRYLRVLSFARLEMESLPDSISTLLHLRYLDLSRNFALKVLPNSITKLHNLQCLKLSGCMYLEKLPKDLSKLGKISVLDISLCYTIKCMPRGMEKLTRLYRLSDFIVGSEENFVSWKQWFYSLQELKALHDLKGELTVRFKWPEHVNDVAAEVDIGKEYIIKSKKYLHSIVIEFGYEEPKVRLDDKGNVALLDALHPHPNVKVLTVRNYRGLRMPHWASFLSNLVKLELDYCEHLKQWRGIVGADELHSLPCLPQLKSLHIKNCPKLTCIPLCPKLERLQFINFNKRLSFGEVGHVSKSLKVVAANSCYMLKSIFIDNVGWLNSLPMEAFQCLEKMNIYNDPEVENLGEVEEVFRRCSSSLRRLDIFNCDKLRSVVSGGLEHLTALEDLSFYGSQCKNLFEDEKEKIMSYPFLLPSLHTLSFMRSSNLEHLPNWMQFLPSLQSLRISECRSLKAMPNWMPKLTSLKRLQVLDCDECLEERCQKEPPGENWLFIQHIPSIKIEKLFWY